MSEAGAATNIGSVSPRQTPMRGITPGPSEDTSTSTSSKGQATRNRKRKEKRKQQVVEGATSDEHSQAVVVDDKSTPHTAGTVASVPKPRPVAPPPPPLDTAQILAERLNRLIQYSAMTIGDVLKGVLNVLTFTFVLLQKPMRVSLL